MDASGDWIQVTCPYCGEAIELLLDPLEKGSFVEDCSVCCNPCQVTVARDEWGDPDVSIERAQ
jgi:Cysteine-rich CPXCG